MRTSRNLCPATVLETVTNAVRRGVRKAPDGRWRAFDREELLARDKASPDLFWLRDASMTDFENLPEPEVLAEEIMENLRSALANFEAVSAE